jgi:hypothetical protein
MGGVYISPSPALRCWCCVWPMPCWASSPPGIRENKKRDCFLKEEEEEEGFEVLKGRQKKRKNKKKSSSLKKGLGEEEKWVWCLQTNTKKEEEELIIFEATREFPDPGFFFFSCW